jgi:hypothetical protein
METQDPNELIAKQFATQRVGLQRKQKQAQDESQMALDRQSALTGLSGGAAIKSKEKADRAINETYADAENQLAGQEASAKLGQNQFQQQFNEQQRQFNEQMNFQLKELDENKKTNLINAATALEKSGFYTNGGADLGKLNQARQLVGGFRNFSI